MFLFLDLVVKEKGKERIEKKDRKISNIYYNKG
jgi:hypothetical protein